MEEEHFFEKLKKRKINRLSNINLRKYLDIILSLLETKNLRKTCKDMDIALGTASKAIQTLEYTLDIKLFVRNGRNGLTPTAEAYKLKEYSEKITTMFEITANAFTQINKPNEENTSIKQHPEINNNANHIAKPIIRIAYHPLALQPYILPAIEKIKQNYNIIVDFTIIERDFAMNKLLSNEIDLIMHPIEGRTLGYAERFLKCEYIGEYELCLFFNKNHSLANVPEKKFNWDIIKTLNIEPNNKKARFTTYEEIINSNYNFRYTIRTFDIFSLYQGLKHNLWVLGLGKEFKQMFNCMDVICKNVKKMPVFSTKIEWYCMYDNNNLKKPIIEDIVNCIINKYNTFKSS